MNAFKITGSYIQRLRDSSADVEFPGGSSLLSRKTRITGFNKPATDILILRERDCYLVCVDRDLTLKEPMHFALPQEISGVARTLEDRGWRIVAVHSSKDRPEEILGDTLARLNIIAWDEITRQDGTPLDGQGSLLKKYSTDLTSLALKNELPEIVERDQEIEKILALILKSETCSCPLLVGHPGTGITSCIYGVTNKALREKMELRILRIELPFLLAGGILPGEKEGWLGDLFEEMVSHRKGNVYVLEAIHLVCGYDSVLLLKNLLDRGVKIIGSVIEEYQPVVYANPYLRNRFQSVMVSEPTPFQTLKILQVVKAELQKKFRVEIPKECIEMVISVGLDMEGFLPSKAIDLLEEVVSYAHLHGCSLIGPDDILHVAGKKTGRRQ